MDAADAGRALALGNRIQEIQQILFGIDNGWAITAMTLTAPEPPPPVLQEPEVLPPPGPPEDEEEDGDQETPEQEEPGEIAPVDEERPPTGDEEPPLEPEGLSAGEVTVDTVGLTYPPQMLQSIRQQELQLWREAYDALAGMGVTNVPQPPTEEPAPTSTTTTAPASATTAATTPAPAVTSRPQTRPFGRRR